MPGPAVGNFSEVVLAEFLLLLEAERAMVGGNHLQGVVRQPLPQFFLVPLLAQRRREHIFRGLESRSIHVFERKVQILRTRFGICRQAAIACLAHFFERLVAGKMHDIHGRAGHFRQRDGAAGGFAFRGRGTRQRMIFRRALPFRQRPLHDHVNRAAVFGVHADQPAIFRRLRHGFEDGARRPPSARRDKP